MAVKLPIKCGMKIFIFLMIFGCNKKEEINQPTYEKEEKRKYDAHVKATIPLGMILAELESMEEPIRFEIGDIVITNVHRAANDFEGTLISIEEPLYNVRILKNTYTDPKFEVVSFLKHELNHATFHVQAANTNFTDLKLYVIYYKNVKIKGIEKELEELKEKAHKSYRSIYGTVYPRR